MVTAYSEKSWYKWQHLIQICQSSSLHNNTVCILGSCRSRSRDVLGVKMRRMVDSYNTGMVGIRFIIIIVVVVVIIFLFIIIIIIYLLLLFFQRVWTLCRMPWV